MNSLFQSALRYGLIACVMTLGACATVTQTERSKRVDPFESANRAVFNFNEGLDKHVVKPVAQAYVKVLPDPVRQGVTNFFGNIGDIFVAANNLLQGKPTQAVSDLGRVLINTTVGILGLFDVASDAGLEKHKEDFGQTLGVWGVNTGPYVVLPLFGPSNVRDTVGFGVDLSTDFVMNTGSLNTEAKVLVNTLRIVNFRANTLDAEHLVEEAALDRYSFIRDSYLQRRRNQVYDGDPPPQKDE